MAETLAPKEPEMHWNAVHEEMWSMVSTSTNMGIAKSVTGTNIQLSCEGGGKMFFHQDRLRQGVTSSVEQGTKEGPSFS